MKKILVDRRKHQRVKVKAGAIVAFKKTRFLNLFKPRFIPMGPIIDISRGGLAVQYIENVKKINASKALSILSTDGQVIFEDLPYTTILDEKIAVLPDSKVIRKWAIQFNELADDQIIQLEKFINNLDTGVMFFKDVKDYADNAPMTDETDGKNKFEIQTDIINHFKEINAKAGQQLTPGWLTDTYIPSLSEAEKSLIERAIKELVNQGVIEGVNEPEPNYRLTRKGENVIYSPSAG